MTGSQRHGKPKKRGDDVAGSKSDGRPKATKSRSDGKSKCWKAEGISNESKKRKKGIGRVAEKTSRTNGRASARDPSKLAHTDGCAGLVGVDVM